MKKKIKIIAIIVLVLLVLFVPIPNGRYKDGGTTGTTTDYPAAIMVEGEVYLYEGAVMTTEIMNSVVTGYTTSYTDTFPQEDGETNFSRELNLPYVKVEYGIAILVDEEWHLCTPKDF